MKKQKQLVTFAGMLMNKGKQLCESFMGVLADRRTHLFLLFCLFGIFGAYADNAAGTRALEKITADINSYIEPVQKVCYAIAGVVAVVGAISVYLAMQNDEQDVKKKIMMTVGACIFLIAAAQALPLFFGDGSATSTTTTP